MASFTIFKAIKEQITNIWLTNDQLWKIIWFRKLYERKKMDHLSQTNNGHCLRIQYLILSFMLGNLKWFLNHITFRKKKSKAIKVNSGVVSGGETRCNLSSLKLFTFLSRKDLVGQDGCISKDPTTSQAVGRDRRALRTLIPSCFSWATWRAAKPQLRHSLCREGGPCVSKRRVVC